MIKLAVVSMIINSSYVLISISPFRKTRIGNQHALGCLGKYIIFYNSPALIRAGEFVYSALISKINGSNSIS